MAERVAARRGARRASGGSGSHDELRVVRAPVRRRTADPAAAAKAARANVILLLVPAALLTAIGLVEVFSASSVSAFTTYDNSFWFFQRQAIYAAIGIGALLVTARMRYAAWQPSVGSAPRCVRWPCCSSRFTRRPGSSVYGASRWIDLGPIHAPTLGVREARAGRLRGDRPRRGSGGTLDDSMHLLLPLAPVVLLVAAIVMLQRDLGTTS